MERRQEELRIATAERDNLLRYGVGRAGVRDFEGGVRKPARVAPLDSRKRGYEGVAYRNSLASDRQRDTLAGGRASMDGGRYARRSTSCLFDIAPVCLHFVSLGCIGQKEQMKQQHLA